VQIKNVSRSPALYSKQYIAARMYGKKFNMHTVVKIEHKNSLRGIGLPVKSMMDVRSETSLLIS